MCSHVRGCSARTLRNASGSVIYNRGDFRARAGEVGAFLTFGVNPTEDRDLLRTYRDCDHLLDLVRENYDNNRVVDEVSEKTLALFSLCPEHARQLSRGALIWGHYAACYGDFSFLPPPKVVWSLGSIGLHDERWVLPVLVVLARACSRGLSGSQDIDLAVSGARYLVRAECAAGHRKGRHIEDHWQSETLCLAKTLDFLCAGPEHASIEGYRLPRMLRRVALEYRGATDSLCRLLVQFLQGFGPAVGPPNVQAASQAPSWITPGYPETQRRTR